MANDHIEITLSRDKLSEIVRAYNILGDFLNHVIPKELLYKNAFLQGLDDALKEVESGNVQKVASFDEFIA
ncbi:MAG: hypothetical protein ACE5I1_26315 [bacterium]